MVRPMLSVVPSGAVPSGAVPHDKVVPGVTVVPGVEVVPGGDPVRGDRPAPEYPAHTRRTLLGDVDMTAEGFGGAWDWTVRAVCVGVDPDALFVTGAAQREAAQICQACPVRLECLADALDNQIEYGVWGGMTERQRRAVLKKSPDVVSWRALLEQARASVTQDEAS